jgi:amidase
MPSSDIVDLSAKDLSRAIHSRSLSCMEVMRAYLAQIERYNPRVNAIVSLRRPDDLLAEAVARDRDLAEGIDRGWMHGFPAAVKDLDAVAGLPWTQGATFLAEQIAQADSIQVERMRRAGAIFIGKTNTPEFGLGSQTFNRVFGATRNPYDPTRTAGGSSGGAAAALALRMLPVADGSDHAGSLRNPAAYNNVFGLRPSFGRVPAKLEDAFTASLGVAGPMARTAEDLALLLSVQAGYDDRAPLSVREDPSVFAEAALGPVPFVRGKRIAWIGDRSGLPFEPGVLDLCRGALATFTALGCEVEDQDPPMPLETIWRAWLVLRAWTVSRSLKPFYDDPQRRAELKPEAVWEVENGRALTVEALAAALAVRTAWYQTVRTMFERFDAILLPSAQVFPFDVDIPWPRRIGDIEMDTYHRWMSVVIPGTMSGCPVIAIPAGFGPQGLPTGLQMICRMHGEGEALAFARAFDAEAGWSRRRPPMLDEEPGRGA